MIHWNDLCEAYRATAQHAGGPGGLQAIEFPLKHGGFHVHATLGAAAGPLGHELVLVSALPFPPFGEALAAFAREATASPAVNAILPCSMPGTPFEALLFLPPGEEIPPAREGGRGLGPAFRVVPLTRGERVLGQRAPGALLPALTRALALEVDPYRPCAVELPPRVPSGKPKVAEVRRHLRSAHRRFLEGLRKEGAREDLSGAWEDEAGTRIRLPPGDRTAMTATFRALLAEALAPVVAGVPPRTALVFAELLYVILATHPDAVRILDQAFDPQETAAAGREGASPESRMAKAADDLALAVSRFRPREPVKELRARAGRAARRAMASFSPSDEVPLENACWAAAFAAVYADIREMGEPRSAVINAIGVIERAEAMLELEPDPRPALVRLREIAQQTASTLYLAYSLHSGAIRGPGPGRGPGGKRSPGGILH